MSKKHEMNRNNKAITPPQTSKRIVPIAFGIVLVVVAVGGFGLWWWVTPKSDFKKLKGDWVRPDGGYIISIRNINSDGRVQAAYFNPNPINVAQAKVAFKGNKVKLFLELRDEGYPGCTYDLSYDQQADQLRGIYYQAAIKESYDIVFLRR